jgi:hypothetical protein
MEAAMRLILPASFLLILMLLLTLAPLATAQDDPIPAPSPTPTITLEAPSLNDVAGTPELLRNFDLPIYLSGVGATPLSSNVNIRSGPGLDYAIIGILRQTHSIDVVGYNGYDLGRSCEGDFSATLDMWITVQRNDQRGWIARCTVQITGDMSRLLVHPAP